ncbi:MAG TPA: class A beta-lactamase-related serine hydrolase [bacterium]|nr:class A beta-lactamase-related serine hydrolase [bacterium]
MKPIKNVFLNILFIFAAALMCCTAEKTDIPESEYGTILPDGRFNSLRNDIQERLKNTGVSSLSISVAQKGNIIWQEAFGLADIERSVKATPYHMYSIASVSKPITAAGLMILIEKGAISLDDPVDKYLGSAHITAYEGEARNATIRRILSHTSGLPTHYHFYYEDEDYPVPQMEEAVRRYGILVTEPGEVYNYSNMGYGILDYIITTVSGTQYADFLQSEVFEPLGMKRTAVITHSSQLQDAAQRYDFHHKPVPFYDFDHRGASAVYSTAHDLVRFGMFHLNQPFPGQKRILNEKTVNLMQKGEAYTEPEKLYGLGWTINENDNGYRTVYHTGIMHGVRAIVKFVPSENIVVSVLSNGKYDLAWRMADDIIGALLTDFAEKRSETVQKQPSESKPAIMDYYMGDWTGEIKTCQGTIPITMKIQSDDMIYVKLADQPEQIMSSVRMERNMLRGQFEGTINTDDAVRRPHRIIMCLKHRGDRISGSATALSTSEREFALTSWIILRKK